MRLYEPGEVILQKTGVVMVDDGEQIIDMEEKTEQTKAH